ncbi:DUF817 family protein [Asticcacaulis sp.]|uniref:DUF817 family protein n=1 Tax=Asticcacaulis sp. TaxID=1872648 RepID=UPI002D0568C1|nr:DUF817 family protein [Asticcacaulis sp.]HTM80259.1 DUF817 family protein [Asticcacaulis sp.]
MLPGPLRGFVLFGLKMAWSCLFGAGMLALMIATHLFWPADGPVHRYDFLLVAAIAIQCLLLWTRLETFDEVKVIFLYACHRHDHGNLQAKSSGRRG